MSTFIRYLATQVGRRFMMAWWASIALAGDGHPDYAVLFQIVETSWDGTVTTTLPNPLFYWVDRTKSGHYTETWIDQGGDGRCQDIVPYWSLPSKVAKDANYPPR
jgi:hypothetical protein